MALINAYRVDTGEKVRVPAHFFDNPILAKPFRKTPKQKASESQTPATRAGSAATPQPNESAKADAKKE